MRMIRNSERRIETFMQVDDPLKYVSSYNLYLLTQNLRTTLSAMVFQKTGFACGRLIVVLRRSKIIPPILCLLGHDADQRFSSFSDFLMHSIHLLVLFMNIVDIGCP